MFDFAERKARLPVWSRLLFTALTGLFLYAYISWFGSEDNLWWPKTVTTAVLTLLLVFATEQITRIGELGLRLLQFAGLLCLNGWLNDFRFIPRKLDSWSDLGAFWYDHMSQLSPFIWFSFGVWVTYLFALWWVQARLRIVVMTVLSVIVLAIRDSFSLVYLWDEVAIIIFSGLSLLVVHHFTEVQLKNPKGWASLAEYPGSLLVTIVFLISVMILPGVFMPSVRPLLKDPYTLIMEWRGETVETIGKLQDFGPSNRGNASSGYSRDDSRLGGAFQYDYTPVFTVDTTHRSYWRGETRDYYTGRGWVHSGESDDAVENVSVGDFLPGGPFWLNARTHKVEVEQTFHFYANGEFQFPVLFGAYSIKRVVSVNGMEEGTGQWNWERAELRLDGDYPVTYTLVSEVPLIDEEAFMEGPTELDPAQRELMAKYLQLPDTLPDRVRELAEEITAGAVSPYEKAKRLADYLRLNYRYTNTPDDSKARSGDFVDAFLFEIQEGYCDYFSTAMAVLARSVGLPARWVKGYASGYNELEDEIEMGLLPVDEGLLDPIGAGTYTVRNSDAHSWVEVYLPSFGWIPFEATAGFELPVIYAASDTAELPALNLPTVTAPQEQVVDAIDNRGWIGGAVIALLAAALAWSFRKPLARVPWKNLWRLLPGRKNRFRTSNEKVVLEFQRLLRHSRRRGFSSYDHETARETINRWKQKDLWLARDLDELLALFEKAKYSPRQVTDEEAQKVAELVEKLRKAM